MTDKIEDEVSEPNKHGVTAGLAFDRFDDWQWEGQDAITNISARAARLVMREMMNDSQFWLREHDGDITVAMVALDADLVFEVNLLHLVRDFIRVHTEEIDRATMRRVLTKALALLDPKGRL